MTPRQSATTPTDPPATPRIAIIGGGSSGLVTLQRIRQNLPDCEVVCFEASGSISGCWGNPYPEFVSTSTKYTTQFAAHPIFDCAVDGSKRGSRADFFRGGEYGDYLRSFASEFSLFGNIRLETSVLRIDRTGSQWHLKAANADGEADEYFDIVIVCTGLVAAPRGLTYGSARTLSNRDEISQIQNSRVVVVGGGESAVDIANRLARSQLNNETYLSVRDGIRVSPRYHPIRGVPSDYLRNRLLLSIHPALRDRIGEWFVRARIRFEPRFRYWFPPRDDTQSIQSGKRSRRVAEQLMKRSRGSLFGSFHNKSDDFLIAVDQGRLRMLGPPVDQDHCQFYDWNDELRRQTHRINPDWIVPAIGYQSTLPKLFGDDALMHISDFYLGTKHTQQPGLYAVGFARPVIGSIPPIAELQAEWICRSIQSDSEPKSPIFDHERDRREKLQRFPTMGDNVYPVEMFPYLDRLARDLKLLPTLRRCGSFHRWLRLRLEPASTQHYFDPRRVQGRIELPWLFILLLAALLPLDWIYRRCVNGSDRTAKLD